MPAAESNRNLLAAWNDGDASAAAVLFDRHVARLTALVRARISRRLARLIDAEDVVMSAFRSFFVAAGDGRLTVPEGDDLWPLLVVLTLRKLARQGERQQSQRRSVHREVEADSQLLATALSHDPSPDQAVILEEELDEILRQLSESDRRVVSLRLQGRSTSSIVAEIGCTDRTVRRALERVRQLIISRGGTDQIQLPSRGIERRGVDGIPPVEVPCALNWAGPEIDFTDIRLLELAGAGGVAKLYRAERLSTSSTVAAKVLRKRLWTNRDAVACMLNEAVIAQRLRHPHIVNLQGVGQFQRGTPFLVFDWIDGGDLQSMIDREPVSIRRAVELIVSVAGAIEAAHGVGILHCDIKPANLLLRKDGNVMLTDFGFGRIAAEHASRPRGGTPAFLAPEQLSDAFGQIGVQTDVYELGATLYALLTGSPPYSGEDCAGVVARVLSLTPCISPSRLRAGIPRWIDAVVNRAMQKEPDDRFGSVAEMAAELRGGLTEGAP